MKLLFDENLSFRLARILDDVYPGSAHVREVGLLGAEDRRIWAFAAENGFIVTSKDSDFYQRSVALGAPPKVIWLRIGNVPTTAAAELLRQRIRDHPSVQRRSRRHVPDLVVHVTALDRRGMGTLRIRLGAAAAA